MKAKLLCDAGAIEKGAAVEIVSTAGTNSDRCAMDVGGESTAAAPVYAVTDADGHAEDVDTRDLIVLR